ncbi:SitI3 family protein, partial [Archangium sp.]|uniref:SitI3 family protein n=1 Tax=Archangium sp. TaxID=1872627 RepID=UPI002D50C906
SSTVLGNVCPMNRGEQNGGKLALRPAECRIQETIKDGFRFIPTLLVGFRFKNNTDHEISSQIMFQTTMLLLEQAQDAVLLFNYEIIVLQRIGGRLTVNSDYHMWDEDWLKSRLTLPFECRPLPSPLL